MTLDELLSLYRGVTDEAEDILTKINENGRTTLKPGSPALAVIYGYEELVVALLHRLFVMQQDVRRAVEF